MLNIIKNLKFFKKWQKPVDCSGTRTGAFKMEVSKDTTALRRHLDEVYKIDLLCRSVSKMLERAIFLIAKFFVINFYRVFSLIRKKWSKKKLLHKASSTTFFWQLFFYSTENSIKILEKNMVNSTIFFTTFLDFWHFFMVYSEVGISSYEVFKSNTSNGSLVSGFGS